MRLRTPSLLVALAAVLALAGCDTNNPGGILRDLAGTYTFTELRFESQGVVPADVLQRLDAARSTVEVDSEGRAFFFFEEIGAGNRLIAEAQVTATATTATFRALNTQDADRFARYLLPATLVLSHAGSGSQFSGAPLVTVNLNRYDPQVYGSSLSAVTGALNVRLTRR